MHAFVPYCWLYKTSSRPTFALKAAYHTLAENLSPLASRRGIVFRLTRPYTYLVRPTDD